MAEDRASLIDALRGYASGGPATAEGIVHGRMPPKVAFVVPGQGAQWPGMARAMLADEPVFRAAIEACDAAAGRWVDWSVIEQLRLDPGMDGSLGDRIDVIQPVLAALAVAYARWLHSLGIEPHAVVGHSMGEVAAAAVAGALDLDQAMRIICRRSALMQRVSGKGAMAVVELSTRDVASRLTGRAADVSVAVSNSPSSTVISGDPDAVAGLREELERDGVFCRLVKVDVASHSPQMAPLADELAIELADLRPSAGTIPMYSTVDGERIAGVELGADYWARNLRQPVRFTDAMARLLGDEVTVFVELSPHPVLNVAVQQNAKAADRQVVAVACGHRDGSEPANALRALGALWAVGAAADWSRCMPGDRHVVPLPLYPWQRERHWIDAATPASLEEARPRSAGLDESAMAWLHVPRWERAPVEASGATPASWLIVAPAGSGADSIAASLAKRGGTVHLLPTIDLALQSLEALPDESARPLRIVLPTDLARQQHVSDAIGALQALQRIWSRKRWSSAARVWWVTRGAQVLDGDSPPAGAEEQAALWGALRVVASEHPDWWGGVVDLAGGDSVVPAELLADHLCSGQDEDQVALRAGERYALRVVRADASVRSSLTAHRWRADGAYLITGGLGGIAQHVAKSMVHQGARRLVLLGHSQLPPRAAWSQVDPESVQGRRIAAVRGLEHDGASVHLLTADVSDEAQVRAALDAYRDEGWPAIRGVIHAAGTMESRLVRDLDGPSIDRVLAPKLQGAMVLDRLLPALDVFVVFSSMMAFWGLAGTASYAAANAGLDALVHLRRARGQHALSIQWGPWANTGLTGGTSAARNSEDLERSGVHSFAAQDGTAFFAPLVSSREPVIGVLSVDWSVVHRARRGRDWPLFRASLEREGGVDDVARGGGFRERASAASPTERRALIERAVRDALGAVLRGAPAQVDARRSFGSMGVDSLMALELRNRLETAVERALPATLAWNYPTIEQLTAHLDAEVAPDPAIDEPTTFATVATPDDDGLAQLLQGVTTLSDDDVARALRGAR